MIQINYSNPLISQEMKRIYGLSLGVNLFEIDPDLKVKDLMAFSIEARKMADFSLFVLFPLTMAVYYNSDVTPFSSALKTTSIIAGILLSYAGFACLQLDASYRDRMYASQLKN